MSKIISELCPKLLCAHHDAPPNRRRYVCIDARDAAGHGTGWYDVEPDDELPVGDSFTFVVIAGER